MNIILSLAVNLFDLSILEKYMDLFMKRRYESSRYFKAAKIVAAVQWSLIIQLEQPVINLLFSSILFFLLSGFYSSALSIRVILIFLYIGLGFITEPLGFILIRILQGIIPYSYATSVIIVELIRLALIQSVGRMKSKTLVKLPPRISVLLLLIPCISILNCCLIIHIAISSNKSDGLVLCLCIVAGIIASNYFLFYLFERYNVLQEEKRMAELYVQEMHYKEIYYADIQTQNQYIYDLKHDMQNRLSGLYDSLDSSNELLRKQISALYAEYESITQTHYTENAILNSIIKLKAANALKESIRLVINIRVPDKLPIDCGDMGILYGNLMDNATEACQKIEKELRYIKLTSSYIKSQLILVIKNSKIPEKNETLKTTKENRQMHGRGLNSVGKVVQKYNGTIKYDDKGTEFEVCVLLYFPIDSIHQQAKREF